MRTYTDKQLATMLADGGYTTHYRVRVYAGSEWYSLTDLEGRNFCRGVSWDSTIDAFVTDATVELTPLVHGASISPIDLDSVVNEIPSDGRPLMDEGRLFVVEVAVMPPQEDPGDDDWVETFRGVSARTNVAGRGQMVGRDYGDALSDILIEVERDYGSEAGVPLVTVMNQILADNGVPFTLVAKSDPDFVCGPFRQKKMLVREALQALADQIGWDVRFMWWDGVGFQLTLWTPNREQTEPDWVYEPWRYKVLSRCETSVENVRNRWVGTYLDKTDLDSTGKPKQKQVVVQDAVSIARYSPIPGANIPRPTMITEAGTTNIDTAEEMTRMLSAALADYKDVFLEVEVDVPFNPFVEVGDLIRLEANPNYFSGDQDLGVQSVVHRLGTTAVSTLTLRGKPSTSRKRWLRLQSSHDVAPTYSTPNPPVSVTATPTVNGFSVKVQADKYGREVDTWELHVSETSPVTPDNSAGSTTLAKTFRGAGTEVTSLTAGRTYYAVLVGRDTKGNRSVPSEEFTLTARYVEPRLLQPRIAYGVLPPNADFEAHNNPAAPPDAWTAVGSTAWNTHVTVTTDSFSGAQAIRFPAGSFAFSPTLQSQLFTVREGDQWSFGVVWAQTTTGTAGTFRVKFLADPDPSGSGIGAGISEALTDLAGEPVGVSWLSLAVGKTVPGGARYASMEIVRAPTYAGVLTVDALDASRNTTYRTQWKDLGDGTDPTYPFDNGWSQWDTTTYHAAGFRRTTAGRCELRGVARSPTPAPAASASMTTLPLEYRPPKTVLRRVNHGSGVADLAIHPNGEVTISIIDAGTYLPLDGIEWDTA